MKVPLLLALLHWPDSPSGASAALFDANPQHLWNRLYSALLIRQDRSGAHDGFDELDPLLWPNAKFLLTGPSHTIGLGTLDEFFRNHGERQIHDPLERALLQRDLWAVFDWSALRRDDYLSSRIERQARLARVLRPFELSEQPGPVLVRCAAFHSAPGVHSLLSLKQLLKPNRAQLDPAHGNNPDTVHGWPSAYADSLPWKESRYDWGLLNGYWQSR